MNKAEFEEFHKQEKIKRETEKKIALEIIELFKSNNLTVYQINNVINIVELEVKYQAHL